MSCPTCDHNLQALDPAADVCRRYWCPRCGTMKTVDAGGFVEVEAPKIVQRARRYQKECLIAGLSTIKSIKMWFTMGLPESLDVPSDRPPV